MFADDETVLDAAEIALGDGYAGYPVKVLRLMHLVRAELARNGFYA